MFSTHFGTDMKMFRNIALSAALTVGSLAATGAAGEPLRPDPVEVGGAVPTRGVVRAVDQAAFTSDLGTRAVRIERREGEAFKAGDLLVEFDCRKPRAEAASAEASHREMRLTLDSNLHLEKQRAIGRYEVEISKARLSKSEAEAEALKARLDQCRVLAPYDGRVAQLSINVHEIPAPGRPFLAIVGAARLEVELIVPSSWLGRLGNGARFEFTVDETGRTHVMRVARIGAAVDPVSQMIKVIAVMEAPDGSILPGMSGTAHFKLGDG